MDATDWLFLLGGGFLLALVFKDAWGSIEFPASFFIFCIIVLTFWESEQFIRWLKLKSSKLIATNFQTTTDGTFIPAGDYAIFTLGDIDYLFRMKGRKGAIICPREAINRFGTHVVLTVNPKLVEDMRELPSEVIEKLKEYGIEPPYYFGLLSERAELSEPDIDKLKQTVLAQNEIINMLRDIMKGKYGSVEDLINMLRRIGEATKEKSLLDRLLGNLGSEEKGEGEK